MVDLDKYTRIKNRLIEHLHPVLDSGVEWVGLFLQGSQNYNLDYDDSDIDSKVIVLPSFEDFVLNKKPVSYTHVMENDEHVDFKDIRLMFDCFRKQNINFIEVLFTRYYILNPKYETLFSPVLNAREKIARYNNYAALSCMVGMAKEKQKALCHPYPATIHKIEQFGFDGKQYHHILRLYEFMQKWIAGNSYSQCLLTSQRDKLIDIKLCKCSLEEAKTNSDETVSAMETLRQIYMENNPVCIDESVNALLNESLVSIIKYAFKEEIERM